MQHTQNDFSDIDWVSALQLFYTYFYNHARRLRLEKLFFNYFWIQMAVSVLKTPNDGFRSKTAVTRPFRKWNGQKFNGYIFNGDFPTDESARSGVTVM
jgi:hypothetical protein